LQCPTIAHQRPCEREMARDCLRFLSTIRPTLRACCASSPVAGQIAYALHTVQVKHYARLRALHDTARRTMDECSHRTGQLPLLSRPNFPNSMTPFLHPHYTAIMCAFLTRTFLANSMFSTRLYTAYTSCALPDEDGRTGGRNVAGERTVRGAMMRYHIR